MIVDKWCSSYSVWLFLEAWPSNRCLYDSVIGPPWRGMECLWSHCKVKMLRWGPRTLQFSHQFSFFWLETFSCTRFFLTVKPRDKLLRNCCFFFLVSCGQKQNLMFTKKCIVHEEYWKHNSAVNSPFGSLKRSTSQVFSSNFERTDWSSAGSIEKLTMASPARPRFCVSRRPFRDGGCKKLRWCSKLDPFCRFKIKCTSTSSWPAP